MMLESIDGLGQSLITNITVERSGGTINMTIGEALPLHSLWNVLTLPYGCETDTIVTELSKL